MRFPCAVPSCDWSLEAREYVDHLSFYHRGSVAELTCKACTSNFTTSQRLYDHLATRHQFFTAVNVTNNTEPEPNEDLMEIDYDGEFAPADNDFGIADTDEDEEPPPDTLTLLKDELHSMMFYLLTEAKMTIKDFDVIIPMLENVLKFAASAMEISELAIQGVIDPYRNWYRRAKVVSQAATYVGIERKAMGSLLLNQRQPDHGFTTVEQSCEYASIPLKEILTAVLLSDDARRHLMLRADVANRAEGMISELVDGHRYKQVLAQEPDKELLPLVFYYDDATPGNHTRKRGPAHNVGYFRFFLGSLPRVYTATNKHFYLKAAGYSHDFSEYNYTAVLDEIVREINTLFASGIDVPFRGSTVRFYPFILTWIGDNKAVDAILRFQQSYGRGYVCRDCFIRGPELQNLRRINDLAMRNIDDYDGIDFSNGRPVRRIIRRSELNDLPHYHVVLNFSHDLMHDILEGEAISQITYLVRHLIESGINLRTINQRIVNFAIGRSDRSNHPSELPADVLSRGPTGQTAAQRWCLVRLLPLIFKNTILENGHIWLSFLHFVKLCQELSALSFDNENLHRLAELIQSHLDNSREIVNIDAEDDDEQDGVDGLVRKIRPKTHYLLHYVEMISMLGPPTSLWCMGLERLNALAKRVSYTSHNYKNIWYTLAKFYQKETCRHLMHDSEEVKTTKPTTIDVSTLALDLSSEPTPIVRVKSLTRLGIDYFDGQIIIVAKEDGQPIFREIVSILRVGIEWKFIGQHIEVVRTNPHFYAYECQRVESFELIPVSSLISPFPLDGYKQRLGSIFDVVLRHRI